VCVSACAFEIQIENSLCDDESWLDLISRLWEVFVISGSVCGERRAFFGKSSQVETLKRHAMIVMARKCHNREATTT
jgi:hypothetical protein